jgi:hypothetical protein
MASRERREGGRNGSARTGKEEQISAMATPTNQVKKVTTTQPQTRDAGPAYCRLVPYSGVIPVKSVIVEKEMASVLNNVCINDTHGTGAITAHPSHLVRNQVLKKEEFTRFHCTT